MQADSDDDSVKMPEQTSPPPLTRSTAALRRDVLVRLGGAAAAVVLLGIVLALAGVPFPSLNTLLPLPYHPPDGWHRYADPDSTFHVWIPPDWASQVSKSYQQGLCITGRGDCFNYAQESVLLGAALQNPTSFAIQISVDPISSGAPVNWWCRSQTTHQPNTSIDGVPAVRTQTSDGRPEWEIFTRNAHFAILPLAVRSTAEQQMTETVVAGFISGTTQPLPCSRS